MRISIFRKLFLGAAMVGACTTACAATGSITVRSFIDDEDFVKIRGNAIWFEHGGACLPGKHSNGNGNEATYINGVAWYPVWIDPRPQEGYSNPGYIEIGTESEPYILPDGCSAIPSGASVSISINEISCRQTVTLAEEPTKENDYTTAIKIKDQLSGPSWYEFEVAWTVLERPVWHVDATNGADTSDGFSWATAKKTIQAAIDLAGDGDTIVVTNGVYGPIITDNKAITIRSASGAEKTIIDGGGTSGCAWLTCIDRDTYTDQHWDTVLEGFTLQNGSAYDFGGVYGGTVKRCIIKNNTCTQPNRLSSGARISILHNCLLLGNSVNAMSHSWAYNCTIVDNGAYGCWDGYAYNCIVYGHNSDFAVMDSSRYSHCYTDDPGFVDAMNGDYRLSADSPCVDAGKNDYIGDGNSLDGSGNPRLVGRAVDIGCYEWQGIDIDDTPVAMHFAPGDVTVSDYSAPYDGVAHGIVVTTADGIADATILYATAQGGPYSDIEPTRKNVGSQTVWCEISAPGYIPQTNSASITITKRALVVKAAAKSKTFGAADPALTYTATGLVGRDTVSGALVRDAGEAVGTYAIRQGTLTAGSNYAINFTGANLTITNATPLPYFVVFNANGGKLPRGKKMAAQSFTYGKSAKLTKNVFTQKGCVFIGWATRKGGPVAYKNAAAVKNLTSKGGTVTLYAVWAKKTYKVKFYANGGKGKMAAQKMTYGKAKKLSANKFKRKGYVFKGWAKSKALAKKSKVAYKNKKAVKNLVTSGKTVKLYAVWKRK